MARTSTVLAACLLLLLSAGVAESKVITIGSGPGKSRFNLWGSDVTTWQATPAHPGDFLLFRWLGQKHDVQQFPDKDSFDRCDFFRADPLGPSRRVSADVYLVRKKEKGTTLYFASQVDGDCEKGLKVAVPVL